MALRLQLWSWNYEPEPTAMGPISAVWARAMRDRGHSIDVVTAHPHYPPGIWKQHILPRREVRDGIEVTRLPLWLGHATTKQRIREELTYSLAAALAMPSRQTPDVIVCVSPSFISLAPMAVNVKARRVPLVLWLQDILPDGAASTGLLRSSWVLGAARSLERFAYRTADRIVVISDSFRENLTRKGVPESKLERLYNPSTRGFERSRGSNGDPRLLSIGNIGYSQGLVQLVRAFEAFRGGSLPRFVIAGHGELAESVRKEIRSDQVKMVGFLDDSRLQAELDQATLGLVSQRGDIEEFNLPSRLMAFMGRGVPVIAVAGPQTELARIIQASGGGWVSDAARPELFPTLLSELVHDRAELERRGKAGHAFASLHFEPKRFAERFEEILYSVIEEPARQAVPHDAPS